MTPQDRLTKITAALSDAPAGMGASTGRDAPEWNPGDAYIIAYYGGGGPDHVAVKPAATVECADVAWLVDENARMRVLLERIHVNQKRSLPDGVREEIENILWGTPIPPDDTDATDAE